MPLVTLVELYFLTIVLLNLTVVEPDLPGVTETVFMSIKQFDCMAEKNNKKSRLPFAAVGSSHQFASQIWPHLSPHLSTQENLSFLGEFPAFDFVKYCIAFMSPFSNTFFKLCSLCF